MKKSILRKYAHLIAVTGINVQKGQEVFVAAELDQLPLGARQRAAGLFLVGAAVAASGHKGRSDSDYRNFQ